MAAPVIQPAGPAERRLPPVAAHPVGLRDRAWHARQRVLNFKALASVFCRTSSVKKASSGSWALR